MSNRSLIEFNHDFTHRLADDFLLALERYLTSASREAAEALERYGVRVVGMRHHSSRFIVEGTPDGFPVRHLKLPSIPGGTDFSKSFGPNAP